MRALIGFWAMILMASIAGAGCFPTLRGFSVPGVDYPQEGRPEASFQGGYETALDILDILLGALDAPDGGSIVFDGRDFAQMSAAERSHLRNVAFGFVFQFYHLLPELNVLENVVFPAMVQLSGVNPSLRTAPERVIRDPYGLGWMFEALDARQAGPEGVPVKRDGTAAPLTDGLLHGKEAQEWMRTELQRMSAFIHEVLARPDAEGQRILNDGGLIGPDALAGIEQETFLILPHAQVLGYMRKKTENYDRWIGGMAKIQAKMRDEFGK